MPQPLNMVYEKDAPLDALKGKTVAVLGYGSQGHAHAQNLRESGIKVIVANRKESANGRLAMEHGFDPLPVDKAVQQGDLIIMRGGWHNWRNETDQPCTVASVMVGAQRRSP